jgi:hypothetical protein
MSFEITVRPYRETDLQRVRSLHERFSDFPLPNLAEPQYIVREVAEIDSNIVALGSIRLTSEVMTILDLNLDVQDRANVVQELLRTGIFKSQKLGIDETHAFLTGGLAQPFALFLKKRMGFVDCKGIPLTLRY